MTEPKRVGLWPLIAVAFVICVVVFDIAYSDDTIQSNDMNTVKGDIAISDRSYGVSQSLGDVDINDCLASTQWGIPVIFAKQSVQENPWCMANSLDAMGAHAAAAKVRCTTETIKAIYPDAAKCEQAVMFQVKPPPKPEMVDRDDEDYERLHARMTAYEERTSKDADNAKKAAQRVNLAVQRVNQADIDRKTYAQQDLEAYKEVIGE